MYGVRKNFVLLKNRGKLTLKSTDFSFEFNKK